MGSNPRRLDGLRPDERAAALLLEHVTGGTVRAHDVGTRQGAYDLHLTYPKGRTAAVEVTIANSLPADPFSLLVLPHVARRLVKVVSAGGVDERHLFIGITSEPSAEAEWPALAAQDVAPYDDVPEGLTRLWIATTGRAPGLASWSRPDGWQHHTR